MDISFSNRTLILSKRFWFLEDKTALDSQGNDCRLKTNDCTNGICKKERVIEKCNRNMEIQKHRNLNTLAKMKCLKVWTFATNLTLILICVSTLSDRVYRCISR